jgi:hypothetical protein
LSTSARTFDLSRLGLGYIAHHGKILFLKTGPVFLQITFGGFTAGKNQQARGIAVQAMHHKDPLARLGVALAHILV